jgi:peptide deformylase
MAILPILEEPHPILKQKAREVTPEEFGTGLVKFLDDMTETMYDAPGVGLAAPQVGDSRRILVADPNNNEDDAPRTIYHMVNPKIIDRSKELITYEESCLSVPKFYLNVKRHLSITVEWKDGMGITYREVFEDFPAIVLQHEMDHLEGVTLLDKTSKLRRSQYLILQKRKSR